MVTVIGVLLIIMGIFLVISVLMQSSKNHRVSGSIAGGAETFFGKQKGKTLDAVFNKLTTVVTIIFVILVLALCFILPTAEEAALEAHVDSLKEAGYDVTAEDFVVNEDGSISLVDPEAFEKKNPGFNEDGTEEKTDDKAGDEEKVESEDQGTSEDEKTSDETVEGGDAEGATTEGENNTEGTTAEGENNTEEAPVVDEK